MSDRLARARKALTDLEGDGLVVASPAQRCYLTGFSGGIGSPYSTDIALIGPDTLDLVVAPIHVGWATAEAVPEAQVRGSAPSWIEAVTETVRARGWRSLLIDDEVLPHATARRLAESLTEAVPLKPLGTALASLRTRKDATEIEAIAESTAVTDRAFTAFAERARPGTTEREAARMVSGLLLEQGADGLAFEVIVASGPNAANPHHRPSDRPLQEGETIIVDMGGRRSRYCSDLTRTLWLGEPSEQFVTVYNAVLSVQRTAIELIEPGRPAREVAKAAFDVLRAAGLGEPAHGLGHGLGLEIHEHPALRESSEDVLEVGQLFSVEPGVYDPAWGGIRIEDVVVVTETGCRDLTTAPTYAFD
jgi:Xaa-Pro aminopeptidase